MNMDGVFSGHIIDARTVFLLAAFLCGSHSVRPSLEMKSMMDCLPLSFRTWWDLGVGEGVKMVK